MIDLVSFSALSFPQKKVPKKGAKGDNAIQKCKSIFWRFLLWKPLSLSGEENNRTKIYLLQNGGSPRPTKFVQTNSLPLEGKVGAT